MDVHVRTKLTQRLVKVVHLGQDADHDDNGEDPGGRIGELVVAAEGEFEGDAEALDGHDGDAADGAADGDVDHRVLLAVLGGDAVDHYQGEDDDDGAVEHEA